MFFEKNTQALLQSDKIHHQYLIEQLQQTVPIQEFELLQTPDKNYTLRYQSIFLHDPQGPVQEAKHIIQTQCIVGADRIHLVLGLGLGYLPDELFQTSAGRIIVYEPDLSLLRFILDNVDLSDLLTSQRVWVAHTSFDLMNLLRKQLLKSDQLDILALQSAAYRMADIIPELMRQLTALEADRIQDQKTGQGFHFKWIEQFFQNYPHFAELGSADQFFGQFQGKPALIISRGPSLDQSLEAIKTVKNSVLLIAVGSAVRRLWEAAIIPDFAVFYDANGIQEQLYGIPDEVLKQIIFLASPFAQPCCYNSPSWQTLLFSAQNNHQFADWLDKTMGKTSQRLEGGGTVSLIAFQAAQAMQCNPIILVGQDLAFPNNQVYAGGISIQLNAEGALDLPQRPDLYTEPETMDTVQGQDGELLPTLKAYKGFIRHFEDLAAQNTRSSSPAELYNASIGGAAIAGFTLKPLTELIPQLPAWNKSFDFPELSEISEQELKNRKLALHKGLTELKADLHQGIQLCRVLINDLNNAKVQPDRIIPSIQSASHEWSQWLLKKEFLSFTVIFELMAFQEQLKQITSPTELADTGLLALLTLLESCESIYQEQLLPWIIATEETMANRDLSIIHFE